MSERVSEKIVTWGFSLVLSALLMFVVIVVGVLVELAIHPFAAIPVFVMGAVFVASYFKEMVRER